jgi:HK97 gp10 family phage protein
VAKGVEVIGMAQLQAALLKAATQTRIAAAQAVQQEVQAVRKDAQDGAPNVTGELDAGIVGESSGIRGQVRSTARHGGFVEHGTYKDEAQPYMAPAAERSRRRFVGRVSALVKTALGDR